MYIELNEINGTKILVNKRDVRAVEQVLLNNGFGYSLNFSKDFTPRKYTGDVAFYVDYNGFISVTENKGDEFWNEYFRSELEEISWEVLF